jgi:hypothetical protein
MLDKLWCTCFQNSYGFGRNVASRFFNHSIDLRNAIAALQKLLD